MKHQIESHNSETHSWWSYLKAFIIALSLLLNQNPTYAQTNNWNNKEQIVSNIDNQNWKNLPQIYQENFNKIPQIYQEKFNKFLAENNAMQEDIIKDFTINFISKEMEADRWISKEHQLLIILHCVYKQKTEQDFYNENGDNIKDITNNNTITIRMKACTAKYGRNLKVHLEKKLEESVVNILKEMISFYETYQKNKDIVTKNELDNAKTKWNQTLNLCENNNIDYKNELAVLLEWDRKKVQEILDFYRVDSNENHTQNLSLNNPEITNDLNKIYNFCANNNHIITQEDQEKIKDTLNNLSIECKKLWIDSIELLKQWAETTRTDISLIIQYYENENLIPPTA